MSDVSKHELETLLRKWLAVKGAPKTFVPPQPVAILVGSVVLSTGVSTDEVLARAGGFRGFQPCPPCVYGFIGKVRAADMEPCKTCMTRKSREFWNDVRDSRLEFFKTAEGLEFVNKYTPPPLPCSPGVSADAKMVATMIRAVAADSPEVEFLGSKQGTPRVKKEIEDDSVDEMLAKEEEVVVIKPEPVSVSRGWWPW